MRVRELAGVQARIRPERDGDVTDGRAGWFRKTIEGC